MSYSPNSLKRGSIGDQKKGVIKRNTRGLDYSSNEFWQAAGGDDRHVAAPAARRSSNRSFSERATAGTPGIYVEHERIAGILIRILEGYC